MGLKTNSDMNDTLSRSLNQQKESDYRERHSPAYRLAAGKAWYLVQCKPNGEQMAVRNLENQNFSAFLPLQKLTRRKGKHFQTKLYPLFPGYLFVAQDPAGGNWRKINNTRGVSRLVCFAAEPTPVPPTIMDQLFERCDETGVFQQSENLVAGDDAKIIRGPFAGAIGKIIEIDPSQRIHLIFDFMGQKSTIAINSAGVVAIS